MILLSVIMRRGEIIKRARIAAGLSQQALAERVGFATNASVSNLERGRHALTVDTAIRIAVACGIQPTDFLTELSEATDAAA